MMRPDFVILNKRLKDTASRFYREAQHGGDLNYATFFPELEKRVEEFFAEQNLTLSYKGRMGRAFPSTLFWGKEYDYGDNTFVKRGEIDLLQANQKVGTLTLEFRMQRGSVRLLEEPKLVLRAE